MPQAEGNVGVPEERALQKGQPEETLMCSEEGVAWTGRVSEERVTREVVTATCSGGSVRAMSGSLSKKVPRLT